MTDRAALVERVAVALTNADHSPIPDNYYKGSHPVVSDWAAFLATATIDLIRAEVLEEAASLTDAQAQVFRDEAHDLKVWGNSAMSKRALAIAEYFAKHAAAIRALKEER